MHTFHGFTLDEAQHLLLEKTVRSGTASARTVIRTRILLQADTGKFAPDWIIAVLQVAVCRRRFD